MAGTRLPRTPTMSERVYRIVDDGDGEWAVLARLWLEEGAGREGRWGVVCRFGSRVAAELYVGDVLRRQAALALDGG